MVPILLSLFISIILKLTNLGSYFILNIFNQKNCINIKTNKIKMSDEQHRDRINKIATEIEKVEEVAKQKETYIKSRIEEEFGPKMGEIEVKLRNQKDILEELNKNINDLTLKKNEVVPVVKKLEKEYSQLKKEREKSLNEKLKAIVKEKQTKTKQIDKEIKLLEKELKTSKD